MHPHGLARTLCYVSLRYVAVVEAVEVEATMQTSCVQSIDEDSENTTSTEPCERLLCEELAESGSDSPLITQPSTASDCRTLASDDEEEITEDSRHLLLSNHSVGNHLTPVAGTSLQSV